MAGQREAIKISEWQCSLSLDRVWGGGVYQGQGRKCAEQHVQPGVSAPQEPEEGFQGQNHQPQTPCCPVGETRGMLCSPRAALLCMSQTSGIGLDTPRPGQETPCSSPPFTTKPRPSRCPNRMQVCASRPGRWPGRRSDASAGQQPPLHGLGLSEGEYRAPVTDSLESKPYTEGRQVSRQAGEPAVCGDPSW